MRGEVKERDKSVIFYVIYLGHSLSTKENHGKEA